MLAQNMPADEALWSRRRKRGVDRRTRAARRWEALRAGYEAQMGCEPMADEDDLLDSLADLALEREVLRARRTGGYPVGPRTALEIVTEMRRLRLALGLGREAEQLTLEQMMDGR
jgi:hypothetical protein